MSQSREVAFNASSPHSSTGNADSYKHEGTPDTRLTAFSPEEGSARSSKYYSSLTLGSSDTQSLRLSGHTLNTFRPALSQVDKDPFTTSQPAVKREQRLSPHANDFQPFSLGFGDRFQSGESTRPRNNHVQWDQTRAPLPNHSAVPSSASGVEFTRYIVIASSRNQAVTAADANTLLSQLESVCGPFRGKRYIYGNGSKVYVRFTNLHDACTVFANARHGGVDWSVDFVKPSFWQLLNPDCNEDLATEGQVMLVVKMGRECLINDARMETYLYNLFAAEADIYRFVKQDILSPGMLRFLVEFYDVDEAKAVVTKYNGFAPPGEGFTLSLSPNKPGAGSAHTESAAEQPTSSTALSSLSEMTSALQRLSLMSPATQPLGTMMANGRPGLGSMGMPLASQVGLYPPSLMYHNQPFGSNPYAVDNYPNHPTAGYHLPTSLTAFSPLYQPSASPGALVHYQPGYPTPTKTVGFSRADSRRQNAQRVSRSPYFNAAGNHNHVETSRIRDGIDVRTTIMLRNIPNKVDQKMLKEIIDESSFGKYDFMYLRIDFANDCNVGYAFINFVDPLDIIDFVEARDHKRWNCYKSDKVAEISYATIQGKDCLVQKFRNSSVMSEPPHYRPKLYFTSNGPHPELVGQEEPFPPPDNISKMRRSMENAAHIGLFTPNAGQQYRDEQRRRRSQFDRGTSLAEFEERNYDDSNFSIYRGM